jgi:hypothetical protein
MIIDPASAPLRDQADVRRSVDEKLGDGGGLSLEQACAKLNAVERVEWIMGELLVSMLDKKLHIWVQGWCSGGAPDGPAAVARIVEAGRRLDPIVADLARWTAFRAASRPGGLFTVVPEVWNGHWTGVVPPFMKALVARWPEGVDPLTLPEPPAWSRAVVAPRAEGARYPEVRVGLTDAAKNCALTAPANSELAAEVVAFALWQGGASDEELDAYYEELGGSGDRLPELFARWVAIDGGEADAATLARLRAAYHPRHPLEIETGVEKLKWPALVLLPAERLEPVAAALAQARTVRLRPTADISFVDYARAALRQDPDILLVDARDATEAGAELLVAALQTGHVVAVCGTSPAVEALEAEARRGGVEVVRR